METLFTTLLTLLILLTAAQIHYRIANLIQISQAEGLGIIQMP